MNTKKACQILKNFTNYLDDKYFLVYGTCLGANREQNVISHDLDIDIGMMAGDFKLAYVNNLIKEGFNLISIFGNINYGLELSFLKQGVKIDLMIFYQEKNTIWNALWDNGGRNGITDIIIHSYNKDLFEIEKKQLGNEYFYSLGEKYIERVYGINWKTPVKKWNWRKDHCCIDDNLRYKIMKKYGK